MSRAGCDVPEMTSRLFIFLRVRACSCISYSSAARYCAQCAAADPTRIMTLKTPARKSARKRTQRDYANLNSGLGSDPNRWQRLIEAKDIKKDPFRRMQGADLEAWLEDDENALREPIVIEKPDGLGMKMPPPDLTVEHVAEYIGEDTPLEVIGASHANMSSFPVNSHILSLKTSHPRQRHRGGILGNGPTTSNSNRRSGTRF